MVRALKIGVPLAVFAIACSLSILAGTPKSLPGAALRWAMLFHVERAASILAVLGTVWLIGWRALHGHFPVKFGNIEYADELKASTEAVDAHEERLKLIENYLELVEAPEDDLD